MIIYGHNSTQLSAEELPHEKCQDCGHEGALSIHTFSTYAHIFWIPTFPYRKYGVAHCGNCNGTFEKSQMNDSLKREYTNAKQLVRPPFWHFSGLILIALLIVGLFVNGKITDSNEAKYIKNPNVGDVYSYEVEGGYSLMKVFLTQDTIIGVIANAYATDKKSGTDELYQEEFSDTMYFTKKDLEGFYNDGTIYEIDRNKIK